MTIHRLQSILLEKITSIQSKQMTKMKLKKLTSSSSTKQVESNVIFLDDLNAGDVVANGGGSTEEQPLREFVRQLVVEGKGNSIQHTNWMKHYIHYTCSVKLHYITLHVDSWEHKLSQERDKSSSNEISGVILLNVVRVNELYFDWTGSSISIKNQLFGINLNTN